MFLDLDELATYVGVSAAGDQAGLAEDAAGACQWVEDQVGPIEARTITEQAWASGTYLRLSETPAAITTIDGAAAEGLALIDGGAVGQISPGWHLVVYETGSLTPPEWAVLAAKAKAKQLWLIRLGPKGDRTGVDYGARADGLIAAHRKGPRP